ncbi:hypothetical protein ACJMK2_033123 [Sinanodonta woodiana]|uniref:Homeobox domain-containing protein n=1 Tax=Sinanodonta woodiana TaxID=1069815 RepID=A0ABD3X5B4_SINWO
MSAMVLSQEGNTPAMFQRHPSPTNYNYNPFTGYGTQGTQPYPQDFNQFTMTDPAMQQAWYNAMYGGNGGRGFEDWSSNYAMSAAPTGNVSPSSYGYRPGTMNMDYNQTGNMTQGQTLTTMTSLGGTPSSNVSPGNSSSSSTSGSPSNKQLRPPYDWMKKSSYQSIPVSGKTRTKDKYRVVYSDHQRLELEKEFHYSRYITIRRKAELAQTLNLSERQVKIWFQNRRAKERKQNKKREESNKIKSEMPSPDEVDSPVQHLPMSSRGQLSIQHAQPQSADSSPAHYSSFQHAQSHVHLPVHGQSQGPVHEHSQMSVQSSMHLPVSPKSPVQSPSSIKADAVHELGTSA